MLRPLTTLAAAAAALLPIVSAIPDPNTLRLDFHKRKTDAGRARSRLARRQTVNTAISNEDILYFINVTVGTPPQSLSLQLDTGSSDIWFPSSNSQICQASSDNCAGSYDSSASSTYEDPNLGTFQIQYVDGTSIQGDYIRDVLNIGQTQVTNLTMASATDTDQGYGIMGIGFDTDESSVQAEQPFRYPNIIDVLASEGKINARAYSLWLDDIESNTGSILFGGVDTDKYNGSLIAIPIQKDADSGAFTSFTVAWTGLTVSGGGKSSDFSPSSPLPIILDSGTTDTLLPDNVANDIFNGVGAVSDPRIGTIVPCDLANDDLTFAFQLGGSSGPKINVPVSEFVVPLLSETPLKFSRGPYAGKEICSFGIEAAGSDPLLFGDTFLRSAYVVYDLENLQIALAQTNTNSGSGTGNVQAFSSGTTAGIPDATTTVTGVSVAQTYAGTDQPLVATSISGTGDAAGATTRSATFALTTSTSGSNSNSGSSSSSAAGMLTVPPVERPTFIVLGATFAAFVFGGALMW